MKQATVMVPVTIRFTDFAKATEIWDDLSTLGSRLAALEHDIDIRTDKVKLRDVRDAMKRGATKSAGSLP